MKRKTITIGIPSSLRIGKQSKHNVVGLVIFVNDRNMQPEVHDWLRSGKPPGLQASEAYRLNINAYQNYVFKLN